MTTQTACLLWIGIFALSSSAAHAQDPQQIIQQAVNAEYQGDENDHSQWTYLEEIRKPNQQVLQWVAATPDGDVQRILEKDDEKLPEPQQLELIQKFLHDAKAQKKQVAENDQDIQRVYLLLKLLPVAFVWTQTGATANTTFLHFEPSPGFHPPSYAARVFSGMTGELVIDNQQHRIRSVRGHLIRDVTFGGGILGRLKKGSSFSLEQGQVGPSLWELTEIHIHLQGRALLFKSVSMQEDDERSQFEPESSDIMLSQAATRVMDQPENLPLPSAAALH